MLTTASESTSQPALKIASRRQSVLALAAAFALCLAISARMVLIPSDYLSLVHQTDFKVYDVASDLVRANLNSYLYEEAGTGVDPQRQYATHNSAIATMARSKGIPKTQLYVYPPFLADVMLPFTSLSVPAGGWTWRFLNLFIAVLSAEMIARLLGFRLVSLRSLLVLAGLFCLTPLWQALHYGQITIVLLALWVAGILLYSTGYKRASALVLSVAVLVKMTPLLVLVPILIWRDWKWLRWFTGGLVAGFLLVCCINSPATLFFYFRNVVPPMSAGIVSRQNETVLSAVSMLWCNGHNYAGMVVPAHVILIGKLLSIVLIGMASFLAFHSRRGPQASQPLVLAAFALLSLCVSPVAWVDSLVIGYILLALLWKRMLAGGRPFSELLLLFLTTVVIGVSATIGNIYGRIDDFTLFQFMPLLLSLLLVLYVLDPRGGLYAADAAC